MTSAIGYVRVSHDSQAESGLSLALQEQKIRDYCSLHGLDLGVVYRDEGVSAGTMARSGLSAALSALRAGEAESVVIWKLDRLSRSVRDLLKMVDDANREGWSLHAVADRIDTSGAMGRFITTILAAVAELERGLISERTKAALEEKRRQGWNPADDQVCAEDGLPQGTKELMLAWHLDGESLHAIATSLNRRHFRTAAGSIWTKSSVQRALRRLEAAART